MPPTDESDQHRDPSAISRARRYSPRGRTLRESNPNRRKRTSAQREDPPEPPAARSGDDRAERRRRAAQRSRQRRATEATPIARDTRRRSGTVASGEGDTAREPKARRGGSNPKRRTTRPAVKPRQRGAAPDSPGTVRSLHGFPRQGNSHRRLRIMATFIIILLVVSGGRLIQLQVFDAASLAASAHEQRLTVQPVPAQRGTIMDRNGTRMAYTVEANYIAVDPTVLTGEPADLAVTLAPLIGRSASEIEPLLATETDTEGKPVEFRFLQRGVDLSTGEQVKELGEPGLIVGHDEKRVVPWRDVAANILGFTGLDGNGLLGVEASYDDWLSGKDGEIAYERSVDGHRIPGAYYREDPTVPGKDLQLTIDSDLQYKTQRILQDTVSEAGAEFGSAVILDSATGEVLSLASTPTYDSARPGDLSDEQMRDYATGEVTDPGSVHKALIFGAGLNEGVIERDTVMAVPQTITKGDETYRDSYPHGGAELSVEGMLAQSSNTGTIMIADELGADTVYEYQQEFGLGTPTGLGMPGEASGMLLPPDQWSGTSYGSIPIGHEDTTTTIQMAAAYGAIANDGEYVQPSLISARLDDDGSAVDSEKPERRRVLSQEAAEDMQYLLQAPIEADTGTGHNAQLDGYRIAGKTGTGLYAEDGRYAEGNVANFVGFGPVDDPRYVVAVSVYVPSEVGGGSTTGDAFGKLNELALEYYGVAPSDVDKPEFHEWG